MQIGPRHAIVCCVLNVTVGMFRLVGTVDCGRLACGWKIVGTVCSECHCRVHIEYKVHGL